MSRRAGRLLLVLGLLAAGALVLRALDEGGDDGGFALENEQTQPPAGAADDRGREPPAQAPPRDDRPSQDGVPRILPPDAAVEDVRDALAAGAAERERDLQSAYDAIARTVRDDERFARNLRTYLSVVHDPVVGGVVLAALGASRSDANLEWLARRLRTASTNEERVGAFLGLTHGESRGTRCSTLGGFTHRAGPLPLRRDVLASVAGFLDSVTVDQAPDVVLPLDGAVRASVDVAALLVVDDTRTCKLYASLDDKARTYLRDSAVRHKALPGAVRRVLESAK